MKQFIALLIVSTTVSVTACAQKIDASKVPLAVKESFIKKFPGITPVWEMEDGKYEAGFDQQKHEMSVLFEANGTMTESEMEISIAELPAAATAYIKKNHPGVTIKEAAKITKADGEVNYEAEVKDGDLIFDSKGNFLKKVKD